MGDEDEDDSRDRDVGGEVLMEVPIAAMLTRIAAMLTMTTLVWSVAMERVQQGPKVMHMKEVPAAAAVRLMRMPLYKILSIRNYHTTMMCKMMLQNQMEAIQQHQSSP